MSYGVLKLDSVVASNIDSYNRSAVSAIDFENGAVCYFTGKSSTAQQGEVWTAAAPITGKLTHLWMVYQPEIVTTSSKYKGLDPDVRNFINKAGEIFSVFKPNLGDLIILTPDAITGTIGANTFITATDQDPFLNWNTAVVAGLSFKLVATTTLSVASGAIDSQRISPAYQFECVALA
jgi:hypothetical protein